MQMTLDRLLDVALVEWTFLAHPLIRPIGILLLLFATVLCIAQARDFRSVTASMIGAATVCFGWMLYLAFDMLPDYLATIVGWANLGIALLAAVGTGTAYAGVRRYARMREFFHHGRWEGYLAGLAGVVLIGLAGRLAYFQVQLTYYPTAAAAGTPIHYGPEQFTFTPPDVRWERRETTVEHAKLMLERNEPAATLLVIAEPIHNQHIAEDLLDTRAASWLRAFDSTVEFGSGEARRIGPLRGYQQVATGSYAERPAVYVTWIGAGDAYLYLLVGIADRERATEAEKEFKKLFGEAFVHHPEMAAMAEGGKLSSTVAGKGAAAQTAETRPPPKSPAEPVPTKPANALGYPVRVGPRDLYNTRYCLFPGPLLSVVMGGDRYLVCRFASYPQLAVFDLDRLDWWTYPSNLEGDFVIAANRDRIFVGQRGGNKLATIPFANRQAVARHELPAGLNLIGATIGRDSTDTPLLVVLPAGMGFYDPKTFAPIAVRPKLPLGAVSPQAIVRASADGHTFAWWDPGSVAPAASRLHLAADGATHLRRPDDLGYLAPDYSGEHIFSGRAGILDAQLIPRDRDRRSSGHLVPAISAAWYLDVQYAPDGSVTASIKRSSDGRLAVSVGDLTEMRRRPADRYLHDAEPTADQRYLYLPAYGRLVTLPWTNDRLILRDIKLPD